MRRRELERQIRHDFRELENVVKGNRQLWNFVFEGRWTAQDAERNYAGCLAKYRRIEEHLDGLIDEWVDKYGEDNNYDQKGY